MKKVLCLFLAISLLALWQCKKSDDFINGNNQQIKGSIYGVVVEKGETDPIVGAAVELYTTIRIDGYYKKDALLYKTVTGSEGQYEFPDLNPDYYIVMVRGNEQYQDSEETLVKVELGRQARADMQLISSGNVNINEYYIVLEGAGIAVQTSDISSDIISKTTAEFLCDASIVGGYSDWRLPTLGELQIIYYNKDLFTGFKADYYWTSTHKEDVSNYYYLLNMYDGSVIWDNEGYTWGSGKYYARAVRTVSGNVSGGSEFFYDFEDATYGFWTMIDADGDGFHWQLVSSTSGIPGNNNSSYCMSSASFDKWSGPLNPDNFLVSPKVSIVHGSTLSYYVCAQDENFAQEHYAIAISTSGNVNPNDFTIVFEETLTSKNVSQGIRGTNEQGNWYKRMIDLSNYAGQDVYIAFRHFNCTDMYRINIDDIRLSTTPGVY